MNAKITLLGAVTLFLSYAASAQSTAPDSVCSGATNVVYEISSAAAGSTFNWWLDTPSAGTIDNSINASNSQIQIDWSTTPGTYTLYVQETTAEGCLGDTASLAITINALPTVAVVADSVCSGYTSTVTLSFTGNGPWNLDYTIDGGSTTVNAVVATSPHVINFPSQTATATFEVVGVTDASGCAATGSMPTAVMFVHPAPSTPTIVHY